MTGKWTTKPWDNMGINAEAEWLSDHMPKCRPRPVTIRLSPKAAAFLVRAYGARFDVTVNQPGDEQAPVESIDELPKCLRIGQDTFEALFEFVWPSRARPIHRKWIDVSVVADKTGFDLLLALTKDPAARDHCRMIDFGLGLPKDAYACGRVVHPVNPPRYAEPTELDGSEVLVAIIDDGIGFANERFRLSQTSTRIQYFWDMRTPPKDPCTADVPFGRVYDKSEIDCELAKLAQDEDQIYRKTGIVDMRSHRRQQVKFAGSHGTHVLDIAAGYDFTDPAEREIARKRPIIAVQLPSEVIEERSDAFTAAFLKFALWKIKQQAIDLAERVHRTQGNRSVVYFPLVVNFSFGTFAGPHDGESPIEQVIEEFVASYRRLSGTPKCEVVMPVGNAFQARTFARVPPRLHDSETAEPTPQAATGDGGMTVYEIPWRAVPDDKTSSFVQVWGPDSMATAGQTFSVTLVPPRAVPVTQEWSRLGQCTELEINGEVVAGLYHQHVPRPDGGVRENVVIALLGTEAEEGKPRAPVGVWRIRVWVHKLMPGEQIDLRVQRDDSLMGQRPTGRQSYFDDPHYVRFEQPSGRLRNSVKNEAGPVTRVGTHNSYATGASPFVVGGYRLSDGAPAAYSGSGPTTSGKPGPHASAMAEESPARLGVRAAGVRSGSTMRQNGTSVAAPAITRALADEFALGGDRQSLTERIMVQDLANQAGIGSEYGPIETRRMGAGRFNNGGEIDGLDAFIHHNPAVGANSAQSPFPPLSRRRRRFPAA